MMVRGGGVQALVALAALFASSRGISSGLETRFISGALSGVFAQKLWGRAGKEVLRRPRLVL